MEPFDAVIEVTLAGVGFAGVEQADIDRSRLDSRVTGLIGVKSVASSVSSLLSIVERSAFCRIVIGVSDNGVCDGNHGDGDGDGDGAATSAVSSASISIDGSCLMVTLPSLVAGV